MIVLPCFLPVLMCGKKEEISCLSCFAQFAAPLRVPLSGPRTPIGARGWRQGACSLLGCLRGAWSFRFWIAPVGARKLRAPFGCTRSQQRHFRTPANARGRAQARKFALNSDVRYCSPARVDVAPARTNPIASWPGARSSNLFLSSALLIASRWAERRPTDYNQLAKRPNSNWTLMRRANTHSLAGAARLQR